MRKLSVLSILAVLIVLHVTSAAALSDPLANCEKVIEEKDFAAAGGNLSEAIHEDLTHFPHGFLQSCHGDISYDAVVSKNGVVIPVFVNHFFWCGKNNRDMDAMFRSNDWHRSIITPRLMAIRFVPPSLQGKPVCVKIHRGWLAESPQKFWSPEEWAHRK